MTVGKNDEKNQGLIGKVSGGKQPQEILQDRMREALMKATPLDLIGRNPDAEIIKGGAYPSSSWFHYPGKCQLTAYADRRLTKVANLSGIHVKKVSRVHAHLIKGTKIIVLRAAPAEDETAFEVSRYTQGYGCWINLVDLLSEANLLVDPGYRERYRVNFVPEGSPLWPGLAINLDEHVKRLRESEPDEEESADQAAQKAAREAEKAARAAEKAARAQEKAARLKAAKEKADMEKADMEKANARAGNRGAEAAGEDKS
jgi:hypothetical protein